MQDAAFKIEKGIPLPPASGRAGGTRAFYALMEVGDSVFFAGGDLTKLAGNTNSWGRYHRRKFSVRRVTENGTAGVRVWRTA